MTSNRKNKRIIRDHMEKTGLNFLEAKLQLETSGLISKPGEPKAVDVSDLNWHPRRTEQRTLAKPLGKVITVTSSKGGAGKTSIALTLAGYIALSSKSGPHRPLKVLALDLDVRDGQIGFFTGFWKPTVMKLLRFGISEKQIEDTVIHDGNLGVDVLLAPRRPRSADELSPEFYGELLDRLRGIYDYIILDTSVSYTDSIRSQVGYGYGTVDKILVLTDPVNTSLFGLSRWIQEVTGPLDQGGLGVSKSRISVVLNRVLPGTDPERSSKVVNSAMELPIVGSIPHKSELFHRAADTEGLARLLGDPEIRAALKRILLSVVDHELGELPDIDSTQEQPEEDGHSN